MNSLIFFLFNLVCVLGDYIYPTSSSTFYVNNSYEIEWDFPDVNQNLTHIFLTHGEPFKLSKFSNNQMVLANELTPVESCFNWNLPYQLNNYSLSDIDWRILLSNSSTPYSGNIGSHTVDSIIYLSDFFKIQSNMNITRIDDTVNLNDPSHFSTNGFILNSTNSPVFKFYLTNESENNLLAIVDSFPYDSEYIIVDQVDDSQFTDGNYPQTFEFSLKNMEDSLFFNTPSLQISVEQNYIKRNISNIPIFLIKLEEKVIDNQNSEFETICINSISDLCIYNLHVKHNGVENIIYNQTSSKYNLIKYPGNYEVWAQVNNQKSNKLSFLVTSTTMTTSTSTSTSISTSTSTSIPTSTSTSISTSTLTSLLTTHSTNNSCADDDSCESGLPITNIIAGIIAALFFLGACYYMCKLSKMGKLSKKVYPQIDIETGRGIENKNYETQETVLNNEAPVRNTPHRITKRVKEPSISRNDNIDTNKPTHYYPDLSRLNSSQNQIVYRNNEFETNHYDEPSNSLTRNRGAYPNAMYFSTEPEYNDPNYGTYFDNYGNKRPIRRRHSSSSYGYGYDYAQPHQQRNDRDQYNHLSSDPQTTSVLQNVEYNHLETRNGKSK